MPGRRSVGLLVVGLVALAAGCGPDVDVREVLELEGIKTGWYDLGVVDGKNKLVPTIAFSLKNTHTTNIRTVQINAVFRRVGEEDEWGSAFVRGIGSEGLDPGGLTPQIVLRSQLGYTGEQARAEMLDHSLFVDARVELFAKHGSAQWARLTEIQIDRQLLIR